MINESKLMKESINPERAEIADLYSHVERAKVKKKSNVRKRVNNTEIPIIE